jgi:3-deoxy-D-manno-octulosonic-acid transferase
MILYNILLHILAILLLPFSLLLLLGKRVREGLHLRLGGRPEGAGSLEGKSLVWIHGASVGEIGAAVELAGRIEEDFPGSRLVVSTLNPVGGRVARDSLGLGEVHTLLPMDFPLILRRAFGGVMRPRIFIILEAELWPNLIWFMKKRKIPVVVVNGRMSCKTHRRYRLVRPLVRSFLGAVEAFYTQTEDDASRLKDLGADPGRVRVAGNLKDDLPPPDNGSGRSEWREQLSIPLETIVLIGASLHPPEVEGLARVFMSLISDHPRLALLLAPRHPHRLEEVFRILEEKGLPFTRRSLGESLRPGGVMVLDTMGELKDVYPAADLVFAGGTMVPVGGHNIMEAAPSGLPIFFGPGTDNYRSAADLLVETGGGKRVENWDELEEGARLLLDYPRERERAAAASREAADRRRGALERIYPDLKKLLDGALSNR